jgi:hypothetical protein
MNRTLCVCFTAALVAVGRVHRWQGVHAAHSRLGRARQNDDDLCAHPVHSRRRRHPGGPALDRGLRRRSTSIPSMTPSWTTAPESPHSAGVGSSLNPPRRAGPAISTGASRVPESSRCEDACFRGVRRIRDPAVPAGAGRQALQ